MQRQGQGLGQRRGLRWRLSRSRGRRSPRSWRGGRRCAAFAYARPGITRGTDAPELAGFVVDHARGRLGEGAAAFERAKAAVRAWVMFPGPLTQVFPAGAPVRDGEVVGVLIRALGLWSLNFTRVAYVVDEEKDGVARFGFAYGTLPEHVECGEERFLVEWRRADDAVWYDLLALSRPRHVLAWLGQPYVRHLQARFRRESVERMQRAVAEGGA